MRATIALILSVVLIPAAACDGTKSSAPVVTSGVDQTVAISDMDEAQAIALCEASKEAGKLTAEMASSVGMCMTAGIMVLAFGGDSASCQAAVDECEAESSGDAGFEVEETEEVPCDGTFGEEIGSECTATVGDYEACGNAALAQQQEAVDMLNCNMDISSGGADSSEEPEPPAECVALEEMGCSLDSFGDQASSDM
ncbi:MAG: hypothetical protein ACPGU1_13520 [Myxococcota bacterium]